MIRLLCPACERGKIPPPDPDVALQRVRCDSCGLEYPSVWGIVDLREYGGEAPACWDDARVAPAADLEKWLVDQFQAASIEELSAAYANGFGLPRSLSDSLRVYLERAGEREAWPIRHLDNCCRRLAGRRLAGRAVLEAGCGSGGAMVHLAARFDEVAGQDVDFGALVLAAKRLTAAGLRDRVVLVAAPLERRVFHAGTFDAVKCTDVVEHVQDPELVLRNLEDQTAPGGILYVLTPNRWSLATPEPHVRLWLVGYLPRAWAERYVQWRLGISYANVARMLSFPGLRRTLHATGNLEVRFVPLEDKYLNPDSRRGRMLKRVFDVPPFTWLSASLRYVQPVLEALCVRRLSDPNAEGALGLPPAGPVPPGVVGRRGTR